VQITASASGNFVSFHEFFQFNREQKSLGARTTHLITGQLKHWLSSKMLALNYSVIHRIRHSCSYCTAYDWLKDQEQQFFHSGIRALEKCWTKCISVAGVCVERFRTSRYGQRSFAVSGPTLWNSLPLYVRDSSLTLTQFCTRLKTPVQ